MDEDAEMEDVSGAAATGGEEEAEDSGGKKRKVSLPFIFPPFSFFFLSSSFLHSFLPSTFSRHLPPLHDQLTHMSSQRAPVSKTSAKPPAKKSKPVSKAKKSKEIIDEEVDEAED